MSKGGRHREARRAAREADAARAREQARAAAEREAFFAAFDAEDEDEGPAFPCPECGAFGRRWARASERPAALAAFDAEWGLAPADPATDRRRVAVCDACGATSVTSGD